MRQDDPGPALERVRGLLVQVRDGVRVFEHVVAHDQLGIGKHDRLDSEDVGPASRELTAGRAWEVRVQERADGLRVVALPRAIGFVTTDGHDDVPPRFRFAHRTPTAFLARALRSSADTPTQRALPPLFPPLRPHSLKMALTALGTAARRRAMRHSVVRAPVSKQDRCQITCVDVCVNVCSVSSRLTVRDQLSYSDKGRLKVATHEWYTRILRGHWYPILGAQPLTGITREAIRTAIGGWLAKGEKSGTVRGKLAVIGACLASAVEDGKLTTNPAFRLGKWARRSDEKAKVVEIFSRVELQRILEVAAQERPEWATSILLLARTGLRIGEMLTLQ
jgi:hypothetical protein